MIWNDLWKKIQGKKNYSPYLLNNPYKSFFPKVIFSTLKKKERKNATNSKLCSSCSQVKTKSKVELINV